MKSIMGPKVETFITRFTGFHCFESDARSRGGCVKLQDAVLGDGHNKILDPRNAAEREKVIQFHKTSTDLFSRVVVNATETTFLTKLKDNRDLRDRFSGFGFVYELKLLFWRKIA